MNSSTNYVEILEGISGGFFALDGEYRFTYWNRAAEEGTGLRRANVLGKNVFEIFPNAKDAELGEKYRTAMEKKSFQSFETSYRDERFEAWYDIRIYPTESGISVFFQDITEQKRQQRQKEMLMEVSHVINVAPHLDDLCLNAGERIAQFMEIPSKFVCIYRYDQRSSLLHLMAPSLVDVRVDPEVEHQIVDEKSQTIAVRTALERKVIVSDELSKSSIAAYFLTETDAIKLKTLISIPLMVQNELQGVLEVLSPKVDSYVHEDLKLLSIISNELAIGMSRKRLMDEITIKNIELENEKKRTDDANETLKRFLATFSHELRAPLNAIVGFSEILTSELTVLPAEKVSDFMKNINESGKHLQGLINDILDLSKIEAGKMELHIEAYPISYFTESVQRVMQAAMQEKQITLTFEVAPEIDQLVVDQTRFKQILVNLVSNAIKYSHVNGRVMVSCRRFVNEIEFQVKDEGVGIKPEDVTRLFQAFTQGKNAKGAKEGTGLGLVITKRLVELHGGHIAVESEWGKGATFRFRIPMVVAGEVIDSADQLLRIVSEQPVTMPDGEKPLVLVIEDNVQASQLIQMYLHEAGYRTELARDGAEGLEKAKHLKPSIITLDMIMPIKDGWQVLKELKRHPICKNIPIIIISITDEKKLGFSMGAVDYFVKPVNKEELVSALRKVPLRIHNHKQHPKVLIIDDDRTAAELIQVMLEAEGYEVIKTMNGKEGVRLAGSENPDLIILDLIMPDISGFNVAYQLKQQQNTRNTPIIILTSMEVDDDTKEQMQGFISTIMSKSRFTKKDLLREINAIEKMK
ncbi:MAG: response regulator [Ignavibacteria bacterium]|nr:response regulator [Ignavibacteria bacterium]MBI3766443.1 response regulator [Ignavibacteriales bacterium]